MKRTFAALAFACLLGVLAGGVSAERPDLGPGESNWIPRDPQGGLSTTYGDVNDLIDCLLGPDVVVTSASLTAAAVAAGTFAGGAGIIGIESGAILSSGDIASIVGPNIGDGTSTNNGFPGDTDLEALVPGFLTNDAAILYIEFECPGGAGEDFSFEYTFWSEEYNEYVFSSFNDPMGIFFNNVGDPVGSNIATVPVFCDIPGIPVAIDNVNCSNPYDPPNGNNCSCFICNDLDDPCNPINTEMDGGTVVFSATGTLEAGTNTLKIAVADAGDSVFDSNVFLRCGSLTCEPPPEVGACCLDDGTCVDFISEDNCLASGGAYQGNNTFCDDIVCPEPTATEQSTWGQIKSTYR